MATAQNGWPVIPLDQCATFLAPNGKLVYVEPSARDILGYLAWRWHFEVTPLPAATYNEGDGRDHRGGVRDGLVVIHGWRPGTKIKGTNVYSNHGSGLATDTNGHLHPYEYTSPKPYRDGFTSAQRTTLRRFRTELRALAGGVDVLRIGLDFSSPRRDAMHLELWGTRAQLDRCAAAIRAAGWIIPTRRGQIADYQRIVGADADDRHGPATTAAVKAFQRRLGVPRTGRWDVPTRDAWEAEKRRPDPAVRRVQRLLVDLGWDLDVDGRHGDQTHAAIAAYATTYSYTGPRTAWAALTAHMEDTIMTLDQIAKDLAAVRAEQDRQAAKQDRQAKILDALPEATVTALLGRRLRGFAVEWWLRAGSLGKDADHSQYPADPGSPADLLHRIAAKILAPVKIVPYDGTQIRDEQEG